MPSSLVGLAGSIGQATFVAARGSVITLTPSAGGEAYIQYTTDSPADVVNNVANWVMWPAGAVNLTATDTLTQMAGLRLVVLSGTATMLIGDPKQLDFDDAGIVWLSDVRIKLRASLTASLVPEVGPLPIFYRDTSGSGLPYIADCNGVLRQSVAGEALFWGARRVYNLCRYSENLTFNGANGWSAVNSASVAIPGTSQQAGPDGNQTAWLITRAATTASSVLRSQTAYTLRAVPHTFSVWLKAGTATSAELRVYISGGVTLVTQIVSVDSTWRRYAVSGTPDGTSAYVYSIAAGDWTSGASVTVLAAFPQLEEIYGTSNVAPSEYVPRDSYPQNSYWYGAGVDGVRYFDTEQANTLNVGTGVVTEVTGAPLTTTKGVATFPSVQQFFLNTASMSTATGSALTITANTVAGPDGAVSAISLTEDTTTATHFASQTLTGINTFDGKYVCYSVFAKYAGAATGRPWIRLSLLDLDGATTKSCFFNIETGSVGTATHGVGYVETLANGWFRCVWSAVPLGTGISDALARIFLSPDGLTVSYLGASKVAYVWGPNVTTALSSTGGEKPLALPYSASAAAANNIPGSLVCYEVEGLLGYTDFAVISDFSAYYIPAQQDKQTYSAVTYIRTSAPVQNAGGVGVYDWDRTGLTIRPNNSPASEQKSMCGWDFYYGDLNNTYFWRANTQYNAGMIALDTTTLPDNSNSKKMFTCVVGGVSGPTEPTWVTTFTTPPNTTSNLTVDGSVRWQVNEQNGISGNWEPYLGCQKVPTGGFLETKRFGWNIAASGYGCYENGVPFVRQTSRLFENGGRSVLRYLPKLLYLGTFGANQGIPPGAIGSASVSALMSNHTSMHKNLRVYNAQMTAEEVAALSTT